MQQNPNKSVNNPNGQSQSILLRNVTSLLFIDNNPSSVIIYIEFSTNSDKTNNKNLLSEKEMEVAIKKFVNFVWNS